MNNLTATINVDVAVIGAGFAGLQAAVDVHKAGLSYAIVEANDRVGGKALTTQLVSIDGIAELGPTWINNETQPRMTGLAEKYNLEVIEQYIKGLGLFYSASGTVLTAKQGQIPEGPTEKDLATVEAILTLTELEAQKFDTERPGHWINGSAPLLPDTSLGDLMEQKGVEVGSFAHTFLTASHRTITGLDPDEVSMHYLLDLLKQTYGWQSLTGDNAQGAQYLWFPHGVSKIPKNMAEDLGPDTITLGDPATHITQTNSSTTVRTKNGRTITAKKVILTAPSNTFTHIEFIPPLPRAKRALANGTLRGRNIKTALIYNSPWWRELGLLGKIASASNGSITTTWELTNSDTGLHALILFTCGSNYDNLVASTTVLERQTALLDELAEIVGTVLGEEKKNIVYDIVEYLERNWYEEPYIEGAPNAAIGPGDWAKLAPAFKNVVGNVHFAGSETASVWKGYMEGAIESGERAAREVVESLGNGTGL